MTSSDQDFVVFSDGNKIVGYNIMKVQNISLLLCLHRIYPYVLVLTYTRHRLQVDDTVSVRELSAQYTGFAVASFTGNLVANGYIYLDMQASSVSSVDVLAAITTDTVGFINNGVTIDAATVTVEGIV